MRMHILYACVTYQTPPPPPHTLNCGKLLMITKCMYIYINYIYYFLHRNMYVLVLHVYICVYVCVRACARARVCV